MQIIAGGDLAFNALLYPDQNVNNFNYFRESVSRGVEHLLGIGREIVDKAKTTYEYITSSYASELARNALRAAGKVFNPNKIGYIHDLSDMQTTQGVMQRWIMACPEVRERYRLQRCSGWGGSYVDPFPGVAMLDHPDYRQAISGLLEDREDDKGEYQWAVMEYFDSYPFDDTPLTQAERIDIRDTWEIARAFMDAGLDPTNEYGGEL